MGVSAQQSPLETGPQSRGHAQISRCFSRCFSRCLARSTRELAQFLARACAAGSGRLLVLVSVLCWRTWTLGSRRGGHSGGSWGTRAPSWTLLWAPLSPPFLLDLLGPRQSQSPNFGLVGTAAWAVGLPAAVRAAAAAVFIQNTGLGVGPAASLGNEASEETHVLTKPETLLGGGAGAEGSWVRKPAELPSFYGDGAGPRGCPWPVTSFGSVFSLTWVLPRGAGISQPGWIPQRGFLRGWRDVIWTGVSFVLASP